MMTHDLDSQGPEIAVRQGRGFKGDTMSSGSLEGLSDGGEFGDEGAAFVSWEWVGDADET